MARRLQSPLRSRAPSEECALPRVESDPVVQRPVRPEQPSGRVDAPDRERSGSFETLLDARTPRAAPPDRASRTRPSGRSDRTPPPDSRDEMQSLRDSENAA